MQEELVSALNTQTQRREDALAGRPNTRASRDDGTRRADTLLRSERVSQSRVQCSRDLEPKGMDV